jgi:CheY-specific phosphatase CheX
MKSIDDLDLQRLVCDATKNVFETMLSKGVDYVEHPESRVISGARVVGSLAFAGDNVGGGIYLEFSDAFARSLAASVLRLDSEGDISQGDVNDVVGELCNMVGGTVSSRLSDLGFECRPTVPFITRGTNFEIELADGTSCRCFVFAYQTERFIIGLYLKTT